MRLVPFWELRMASISQNIAFKLLKLANFIKLRTFDSIYTLLLFILNALKGWIHSIVWYRVLAIVNMINKLCLSSISILIGLCLYPPNYLRVHLFAKISRHYLVAVKAIKDGQNKLQCILLTAENSIDLWWA